MNQFKRAQVIMLPTENKQSENILWIDSLFSKLQFDICNYWNSVYHKRVKLSHLYIISDDEIKEGDWRMMVDNTSCLYGQFERHLGAHECGDQWKKIIATTDSSLKRAVPQLQLGEKFNDYYPLPQPSQQFIEKYIESYNKDEIITDVLVEYELLGHEEIPSKFWEERYKVNPKDNTITIKKLKDSWNREEVIFLLKKFNRDIAGLCNKDDNWIEKNL